MWLAGLIGGKESSGRRLAFEVQSFKIDHWITEAVCSSEQEARMLANKLLLSRTGIRIIREFAGSSDQPGYETIIFSEIREEDAKAVVVAMVDEAPLCSKPSDYLSPESRRVISRMLRQYLEQRALTTSELLHHPAEMKRAMNFEAMVPVAVSRVANLQGRMPGQDVRERRDQIYAALAEIRRRAEVASKRPLHSPRQVGFAAAMAAVTEAAAGDAETGEQLAKVMLCRDLVQIRSLLGKVEWLLELAGEQEAPDAHLAIIDSLVADALSFPVVVQDLLGYQPDLGTALGRLLDVLDGTYEQDPRERAPGITTLLARWVGGGQAPQSRAALMESLRRSISLTTPLARDPAVQRQRFIGLLGRLVGVSGVFGGPQMAEALVHGGLRLIEQGGAQGRRIAIDLILGLLPTARDGLLYLAELSRSELGTREQALLQFRAEHILSQQGEVNRLVPPETPLKAKMQMMSGLYRAMLASGFPEPVRTNLADRIDDSIADFIVRRRVIEQLDDPNAHLRVRAARLVQFAATDVLASPKARRIVRDQIIGHLRQPNFDGRYVEGLGTPQDMAAALRTFYDLLRQAEFM